MASDKATIAALKQFAFEFMQYVRSQHAGLIQYGDFPGLLGLYEKYTPLHESLEKQYDLTPHVLIETDKSGKVLDHVLTIGGTEIAHDFDAVEGG